MKLLSLAMAVSTRAWLRILQINDVYELDNFARLQTLVNHYRNDSSADTTIVVCAGDFLAPSLLSSLDRGASMVDVLNAIGVDYVCFGNHEADVALEALGQRMQQSNFEWINTNMRDMDEVLGECTPSYCTVSVKDKRVALLGLLTDDESLYRPGAFGDAHISPIVPAAQSIQKELELSHDLIIPLTHQSIQEDRAFCQAFGGTTFPIVCGGHDHEVYLETVNGAQIVKSGMDAIQCAVIDVKWSDRDEDSPNVSVEMMPVSKFEPDPVMLQRVEDHQLILKELEAARLFRINDWSKETFSTRNNRLGESTGTSALCSMLRMGMRAQVCLLNAGCVRANTEYDQEYFTWSDLKAEMPFSTGMTACWLPGIVLEETLVNSRRFAKREPPQASGGYLHYCNNVRMQNDKIASIRGAPFDGDKMYLTALPAQFFDGIDDQRPLLEYAKEKKLHVDEESSIPAKSVLVEVFSALLWLRLGSFADIDTNKDGVLHREEVKRRVAQIYQSDVVADLVVDNIFAIADMSNEGIITPLEMMIVQFVATDMVDHVCTQKELKTMRDVACQVLGKHPSHDQVSKMVERIRDTIDVAKDGLIHRSEVMKALGKLTRSDLLR